MITGPVCWHAAVKFVNMNTAPSFWYWCSCMKEILPTLHLSRKHTWCHILALYTWIWWTAVNFMQIVGDFVKRVEESSRVIEDILVLMIWSPTLVTPLPYLILTCLVQLVICALVSLKHPGNHSYSLRSFHQNYHLWGIRCKDS